MKTKLILILALLLVVKMNVLLAEIKNANTIWNMTELKQTPDFQVISKKNGVYGIIYKGAMYKGSKSDVFAYYCTPGILKGDSSLDKDLPAAVCVHGGGGKAYIQWVKSWAEKGFAAIAMDLRGYGPDSLRLPNGFIENNFKTAYFTCYDDFTSDWFYQAVANVVYAHSLISSFKEVNPQKTAITGVSWGGIITTLVAGLDNRFKVACPVYGCGFLYNTGSMAPQIARQPEFAQQRWKEQYDPSVYVGNAQIPILFINGTNDNHFFLDQFSETLKLVKNRDISLRVGLKHGHGPAWQLPEVQNYIAAALKVSNTTTPGKVTEIKVTNKKIIAIVSNNVNKAFLNYTLSNNLSPKSEWIEQAISIDGNKINCEIVPDCKYWFLSVEDQAKNRTSTEIYSN
jgi:cephalosporin-C deacetylase-like acetyl esterase